MQAVAISQKPQPPMGNSDTRGLAPLQWDSCGGLRKTPWGNFLSFIPAELSSAAALSTFLLSPPSDPPLFKFLLCA